MTDCSRCRNPVDDEDVENLRVTREEAIEFSEHRIKQGDVVCVVCFHEIKWKPPSVDEGYPPDRYGPSMGDGT